jgi:hypothetical protein
VSKLPIPVAALTQHTIALGKTRSGKSSKLRLCAEYLLDAGEALGIIDVKGDWWGIKSSADGKGSGYPLVIFGGEHADVPINEHSGAHVAELVATGNRPYLIDLGGWMIGERTRFFIAFASTLFKFTKGKRYLVMPECHNFAPKGKIFDPEAGKCLHWANRLASEGQGKGLILLADSQRPQKVHNDFLTSCETLIACRVVHKADRDAIKDWIDGCADPSTGKQLLGELAQMQRTDAWVWSPEINFGPERITWPMFRTYDSFKPQPANAGKLKGWAEVDLDDVKAKLGKVVEEAAANDPKVLKARIAELEREIKVGFGAASTALIPRETYEADKLAADGAGYARGLTAGRAESQRHYNDFRNIRETSLQMVAGCRTLIEKLEGFAKIASEREKQILDSPKSAAADSNARRIRNPERPRAAPAIARSTLGVSGGSPDRASVSGPQRIILDRLAVLRDRDIYPAKRETLAAFCKVSPSSSGYEKNLSTLKTRGLLEYPQQGYVSLTDAGAAAAQPEDDGKPLSDFWLAILNEPKAKIVNALLDNDGEEMSREDLAVAAGQSNTSSGFEKNLSTLKTLGAIRYPRSGFVELTESVRP